jgi:hypothetical protein
MSLKRKHVLTQQKEYSERRLKDRQAFLTGKGLDAAKVEKDPIYRKLRADVRAIDGRLRTIAAGEKLTEDLKKMKADRAAAALKEKEAPAEKPKKAPQEAKAKKEKGEKGEKGEKKPAGPKPEGGKAPEGAKPPKAEGAPKEAKAPKVAEKEAPAPDAQPEDAKRKPE